MTPSVTVSEAGFERRLDDVRAAAAGPSAGVFGPNSMMWRVDREAAVFLGAGRALLLQLAHPWVAAAIADHSQSLDDPIGRFHRTFDSVFTMVFGSLDQAMSAARRLHRRHAEIGGALPRALGPFPAGSRYRADDVAALAWVHATLIETAALAHDLVLPPPDPIDRERYYAESRLFAALFDIPEGALPPDWASFLGACEATTQSNLLTVGDAARRIADALFYGGKTRLRAPFWYRAVTARMLPARLREPFGLRYGEAEHRAAERALARLRLIYPRLPPLLRFVGPYREACGRLAGHARPPLLTRLANRFWIGHDRMAD